MKRCPNCTTEYFDEMLEFCLEDGARLFHVSKPFRDAPPVTRQNTSVPFTKKTLNLSFDGEDKTVERINSGADKTLRQENFSVEKKFSAGSKILEISPVIFALSHNWWQWLYAVNQPSSTITGFLVSANFLVWIILLTIGTGIGLLAFRRCENKVYAVIGLVILSVNLILFLVPKR